MILVIDGPPASGKSTLVRLLARNYRTKTFCYKRLGLINILSTLLLKMIQREQSRRLGGDRVDPVILVDSKYLKRISALTTTLEVVYKFVMYALLLSSALLKQDLVIDEGISLGWANYLNLMLSKKALKPSQVSILMKLDLVTFRTLSRIQKIYYYFIDRSLKELETLWRKRGNIVPYDVKYFLVVKYSFNLFVSVHKKYGIKAIVKHVT